MANFNYRLTTKSDIDGKKQIVVRVDLTATIRPSFKTGVYVNPELFTDGKGEIKIPRAKIVKGGAIAVNQVEIDEATRAKTQLNKYTATLNDIILQSRGHVEAKEMKEWIKAVLSLKSLSTISPFTYDNILAAMEAEKAAEQAAKIGTIYDYIAEYCATPHKYGNGLIKKISFKRKQSFYTLARTLARYEYYKQHTGNRTFSLYVPDITHKTIEDFISYFKNEGDIAAKYPSIFADIQEKTNGVIKDNITGYKKKVTNHSTSSAMLFYSVLGTLFDWMVKERVIDANPCRDAMIETPKQYEKDILWLTIQQRDKLADAPLKGIRRQVTRDLFIFACHTGCRISDIQNLTPKNILYNVADKYTGDVFSVLSYEPVKTSHGKKENKVFVALSPKALEIVEKYKGTTRNGKLFPATTTANYDRLLKKIFADAGLTDPVEVVNPDTGERATRPLCELATSHLARKTFTQNLYLATSNVMMVKKAAGHTDTSRVTETTYISESVGMQAEAIKRMNQTATTSNEERAK